MLGEMLQYKNYHDDPTKPPFPWDAEAARWSREYRKSHPNIFPVDHRELLRPERVKLNADSARPATGKPGIRLSAAAPSIKSPASSAIKAGPVAAIKPAAAVAIKPAAAPATQRAGAPAVKPAARPGPKSILTILRPKAGSTTVKPKSKVRIK
jgi:hypothetical protein